MLGGGVLHALRQTHHRYVLGHHVHDEIGGQAAGAVGEPLDDVRVAQRCYPDRAALIVDLGVVVQHLELGDHVRQLTQLPGPQTGGGIPVQHGDLVEADLVHLGGEVAGLHGQQLAVAGGPQYHPGADGADGDGRDQGDEQQEGHGALLPDEVGVALDAVSLETGGDHRADAIHRAAQEHEHIELLGVEVQGRQLQIEVDGGEHQRHRQVDEGPGKGVADGLPGLAGLFLPLELAEVRLAAVSAGASGIESAEIECERHGISSSFV